MSSSVIASIFAKSARPRLGLSSLLAFIVRLSLTSIAPSRRDDSPNTLAPAPDPVGIDDRQGTPVGHAYGGDSTFAVVAARIVPFQCAAPEDERRELDPGCAHSRAKKENPQCNDGLDNDADTLIDFPFDTNCATATGTNEAPPPPPGGGGCGIGPELAALLPLLAWARRRRHASSRFE